MNDGKTCEILPTDKKEKIIWTHGLQGCLGTLVFTEQKDGKKNATLTHFDTQSISENVNKLKELLSTTPSIKEAEVKQTILVMESGEYVYKGGKDFELKAKRPEAADELIKAIKAELGNDIDIKPVLYPMEYGRGEEKDVGVLIARIPPEGQATYRTWFSSGQLGRTDEERIKKIEE